MKITIYLLLFSLLLANCHSPDTGVSTTILPADTIIGGNREAEPNSADMECDTLKLRDFKSNVLEVKIKMGPELQNEIGHIADSFMTSLRKQDTTYIGHKPYIHDIKYYHTTTGAEYTLFNYAYKIEGPEAGMDQASADFIVFGVRQAGKTIFYDIANDEAGEIQLILSGFEKDKNGIVIWGEMYPYFAPRYGKFKLSTAQDGWMYEFECERKTP